MNVYGIKLYRTESLFQVGTKWVSLVFALESVIFLVTVPIL